MSVIDLLSGGVILSSLGIIGFASMGSKLPEGEVQNGEPATAPDDPATHKDIETIRALNQVRPVTRQESGLGIERQPNGVYGFSWAPHQESPLFQKRGFQGFEVHKLHDGSVHLIGFVTEDEASQLSSFDKDFSLDVYPEPWGKATKAVSIPASRVNRARGPSRMNGSPLKLEMSPAAERPN